MSTLWRRCTAHTRVYFYATEQRGWGVGAITGGLGWRDSVLPVRFDLERVWGGGERRGCAWSWRQSPCAWQVDYMDENEEYFQRQASHRQSRRRFRKINQKGERQTIIDTVDPYPTGKPPIGRGYHTVSGWCRTVVFLFNPRCGASLCAASLLFVSLPFAVLLRTFESLPWASLLSPSCCAVLLCCDVPCPRECSTCSPQVALRKCF